MLMQKSKLESWRQFIIGMILYALIIMLQAFVLKPNQLPVWAVIPLALAPLVPVIWAMLGWLNVIKHSDELQQAIHREAGLLALAMTATLTFAYGFLEAYLKLPRLSMFLVMPLISLTYCLGLWLAYRRYK